MEKMKELYQKVLNDPTLQAKFNTIMKEAEKADREETEKKLLAFANAAGYDLTIEDAAVFFSAPESTAEGELSDAEMDMVAGGKTFTLGSGGPSRGNHFL